MLSDHYQHLSSRLNLSLRNRLAHGQLEPCTVYGDISLPLSLRPYILHLKTVIVPLTLVSQLDLLELTTAMEGIF
jgi:hypothetical protein